MHKYILRAALFLMMVSLFLGLMPGIASATDPTTVVSGCNSLEITNQGQSFSANGYYVKFYVGNSGTSYCKSLELGNNTWSAASADLGSSASGLSVWWDGTYVYKVRCAQVGGRPMYFRRGELESDGTITWAAESFIGNGNSGSYTAAWSGLPDICVDASGSYWIAWSYYDGPNGGNSVRVIRCDSGNETWVSDYSFNVGNYGYYLAVNIVPVSTGVVVVWGQFVTNPKSVFCRYWNGSGWEDTHSISGLTLGKPDNYWCLGDADSVDILYTQSAASAYDLYYTTYNVSTETFATPELVYNGTNPDIRAAMVRNTDDDSIWAYWANDPTDQSVYAMVLDGFIWGDPQLLYDGAYDIGERTVATDYEAEGDYIGVYWCTTSIKHYAVSGLGNGGNQSAPYGVTMAASNVTSRSAQLNGHVVSDGNLTTSAEFEYYIEGIEDFNGSEIIADWAVVVGNFTSGEDVVYAIGNLSPDTEYKYHLYLENAAGDHTANTITFNTLSEGNSSAPVVYTYPVAFAGFVPVGQGALLWDGNLDCVAGFQYRLDGTSTWSSFEIGSWYSSTDFRLHIYHTGNFFWASLRNLEQNKQYEYRAFCRNAIDYGYGEIRHFSSGVQGGAVTPTPVVDIGGPIGDWLSDLSGGMKVFFAILLTILGMILVAYVLRKSKGAAVLCCAAVGLGLVIAFVLWGWLPTWVIILLAAVVGLGLLFFLLGRH